ncbi:MAG TPA: DUF917 domain-containing protein [Gaiellaceae bacterium]
MERVTQLDASNLPALARGCAILGTGGGGDPYVGLLMALQAIEEFGPVEVVDLADLPDDGLVMPCGMVGAPTVSIEKLGNGEEGGRLRDRVEQLFGRPVVALLAGEIGGSNGILPASWAARLGLPVVDADGMGRAFPEIPMMTMELAGISPRPSVMTDERGNVVVFDAIDGNWTERLERAAAVEFGGKAASAEYMLTVAQARTATVRNTVTLAVRIGRVLEQAETEPLGALAAELDAVILLRGKVVDVERRTTGGFVRGSATVEGLGEDAGRTVVLEIQNENLVALEDGELRAIVPDLISVLDVESAEAITTERLRYGQRVAVIAYPCDPVWRTAAGLELAGPTAFGYDHPYVPVEELHGRA